MAHIKVVRRSMRPEEWTDLRFGWLKRHIYSSKWEITHATKEISSKVKEGILSVDDITDELIGKHLCTSFMPDPDLLIRTGGEVRLSNYLLWQCAYSELYFCDTFWPDFKEEELCPNYKNMFEIVLDELGD